jgi:hypothetical protein
MDANGDLSCDAPDAALAGPLKAGIPKIGRETGFAKA